MVRYLAAACVAIGLAGCASVSPSSGSKSDSPSVSDEAPIHLLANPNTPIVSVVEDGSDVVIVVDQEPIFHRKGAADKSMNWVLDSSSRLKWNLVDVAVGPDSHGKYVIRDCAPINDFKFRCKTNEGDAGLYKYRIKVQRRADPKDTVVSPDPFIRNG